MHTGQVLGEGLDLVILMHERHRGWMARGQRVESPSVFVASLSVAVGK